jgi:hypothetical protein
MMKNSKKELQKKKLQSALRENLLRRKNTEEKIKNNDKNQKNN